MYAITGITGKVGGALADALLQAGLPVRAIVRDAAKGARWAARGCEVALADMDDARALTAAFTGAQAVFLLPPPEFDPEPGFAKQRREIGIFRAALEAARPARVVCLSSVGADATQENLLTLRTLLEEDLADLPMPVTFLRPGWFIDNALWDIPSARDEGVIRSFLQPLDKRFPMIAARDVGLAAAASMQEQWTGQHVIELEGPARISPNDIAAAFSRALGRPVRAQIVPRESWKSLFRAQGARNPLPRIRMLDGFNEGWIDFAEGGRHARKGTTSLDEAIAALVAQATLPAAA